MNFLLFAFEDLAGDVAGFVGLRPIDFRLHIGLVPGCGTASTPSLQDVRADTLGFFRLDGARMRLLLGNTYGHESIEDLFALHFQLSR